MAHLIIRRGDTRLDIPFDGTPVLSDVLERAGVFLSHPCGGRGVCGKCAVSLSGKTSAPNEAEIRLGVRLACQARLLGDCEVALPDARILTQIETGSAAVPFRAPMTGRLGAAIDIGTTTLALRVYDLANGAAIGEATAMNPQRTVAADVMGRIGAAMDGALSKMQAQVTEAIDALLTEAAGSDAARIDTLVVTGNTTMLYLLAGRDPTCLSHAPFEADCLFGTWTTLLDRRAYQPRCMNAFVGADITCALLASGLTMQDSPALLCDIGTNGEIALWTGERLFVTSTAAGPAFEGAGISCGCGSVPGAVDRVIVQGDQIAAHTIDEAKAVGVCGSGLIDAVAAYLRLGVIDETGATDADELPLRDGIALTGADVRAVQLAKAAIAAGIGTLRDAAGMPAIERFCIAGGFGSHLNIDSAVAIGLIPADLKARATAIGNAALTGAARLLLDTAEVERANAIARRAEHVNLGGNPRFNARYIDEMLFPEP